MELFLAKVFKFYKISIFLSYSDYYNSLTPKIFLSTHICNYLFLTICNRFISCIVTILSCGLAIRTTFGVYQLQAYIILGGGWLSYYAGFIASSLNVIQSMAYLLLYSWLLVILNNFEHHKTGYRFSLSHSHFLTHSLTHFLSLSHRHRLLKQHNL